MNFFVSFLLENMKREAKTSRRIKNREKVLSSKFPFQCFAKGCFWGESFAFKRNDICGKQSFKISCFEFPNNVK